MNLDPKGTFGGTNSLFLKKYSKYTLTVSKEPGSMTHALSDLKDLSQAGQYRSS